MIRRNRRQICNYAKNDYVGRQPIVGTHVPKLIEEKGVLAPVLACRIACATRSEHSLRQGEIRLLKTGNVAPEFILPDENGDEVSLTQLLEHGPIFLYFYPADFTPGCTKEACALRDIHDEILSVGLRVVGISPQDAESHTNFKDEHNLPFTLICDPDKIAIKMYDVDGPFGVGVRRVTYLITQGQKIQDVLTADIKIDKHRDFIQRIIVLRESAGIKVETPAK